MEDKMEKVFKNQSLISRILKHKELPIYISTEFTFWRCVNVEEWVYGKTISEIHSNNLRENDNTNRYSKLFPNKKLSYWSASKPTALAEIKKHGGNKNYLTFKAYDDSSSTFPMLNIGEELIIIDGRDFQFYKILLKIESDEDLSDTEKELIQLIKNENPDCLAFRSVAKEEGLNFIFFEKGFRKLALKEVKLYFGENKSKNSNSVVCAAGSDYSPIIKNYGIYFEEIAKTKMDKEYLKSKEYQIRKNNRKNISI